MNLNNATDMLRLLQKQIEAELKKATYFGTESFSSTSANKPTPPEKENILEGNDLERLIKLLKKTQGSNDNETLMAIRMSNSFLEKKGWTWDSLLEGKVKVVADPFSMVKPIPKKAEPACPQYDPNEIQRRQQQARDAKAHADFVYRERLAREARDRIAREDAMRAAQFNNPTTKAWPQSSNAQRPDPFSTPSPRISPLRANKYPGNCWQCGYFVDRNAGHIFQCSSTSTGNWEILCVPCEQATQGGTKQVSLSRAIRKSGPPPGTAPSVDQL